MAAAAKILDMGLGQNGLFAFSRGQGVLMANNEPMQQYINEGYFRVVTCYVWVGGVPEPYRQTRVFHRGVDFIRKRLLACGYHPLERGRARRYMLQ